MAAMLSGLSTWFFSQQQQQSENQKENSVKDQTVGYVTGTFDAAAGRPSTSSKHSTMGHYKHKRAGDKFHRGQEDGGVTRMVDCHCDIDDETDDESDYTLNDEEWVWVCSRKEKVPPMRARMCNYSWYKIDDQLDVNTISIHNEWQIEPPSCFTRTSVPEMERLTNRVAQCAEDCQQSINEVSVFENLLIEHPSMSIYDQFPDRRSSLENSPAKKDTSHAISDSQEPNSSKATQPRQGLKSIENNIFISHSPVTYSQRIPTKVYRPLNPRSPSFDVENRPLPVSRLPIFDPASSPPPCYEDAVSGAVHFVDQSPSLAGGADWSASDTTLDELSNQNRRRRTAHHHQLRHNRGGKKSGGLLTPLDNIVAADNEEKLMSLSDCLKNVYRKFL